MGDLQGVRETPSHSHALCVSHLPGQASLLMPTSPTPAPFSVPPRGWEGRGQQVHGGASWEWEAGRRKGWTWKQLGASGASFALGQEDNRKFSSYRGVNPILPVRWLGVGVPSGWGVGPAPSSAPDERLRTSRCWLWGWDRERAPHPCLGGGGSLENPAGRTRFCSTHDDCVTTRCRGKACSNSTRV